MGQLPHRVSPPVIGAPAWGPPRDRILEFSTRGSAVLGGTGRHWTPSGPSRSAGETLWDDSQLTPGPTSFIAQNGETANMKTNPIASMYGIYANIGGILMVNVTIYSIHGSYGNSHGISINSHEPAIVQQVVHRWVSNSGERLRCTLVQQPAFAARWRCGAWLYQLGWVKDKPTEFSSWPPRKTICLSCWWFQSLWKILVSWDDYSQYMENVPNHQPVIYIYTYIDCHSPSKWLYHLSIHPKRNREWMGIVRNCRPPFMAKNQQTY